MRLFVCSIFVFIHIQTIAGSFILLTIDIVLRFYFAVIWRCSGLFFLLSGNTLDLANCIGGVIYSRRWRFIKWQFTLNEHLTKSFVILWGKRSNYKGLPFIGWTKLFFFALFSVEKLKTTAHFNKLQFEKNEGEKIYKSMNLLI